MRHTGVTGTMALPEGWSEIGWVLSDVGSLITEVRIRGDALARDLSGFSLPTEQATINVRREAVGAADRIYKEAAFKRDVLEFKVVLLKRLKAIHESRRVLEEVRNVDYVPRQRE